MTEVPSDAKEAQSISAQLAAGAISAGGDKLQAMFQDYYECRSVRKVAEKWGYDYEKTLRISQVDKWKIRARLLDRTAKFAERFFGWLDRESKKNPGVLAKYGKPVREWNKAIEDLWGRTTLADQEDKDPTPEPRAGISIKND